MRERPPDRLIWLPRCGKPNRIARTELRFGRSPSACCCTAPVRPARPPAGAHAGRCARLRRPAVPGPAGGSRPTARRRAHRPRPAARHDTPQGPRLCAHRGGTRPRRGAPRPVRYQRFRQWKQGVNGRVTHCGNAVRYRYRFPPPPGGSGNGNGNDDLQAVRCRARGNVLRSGRYLQAATQPTNEDRKPYGPRCPVESGQQPMAGRTRRSQRRPPLPCSRSARSRGWLARTVVPSAPGAGEEQPAPNAGSAGGADAAPGRTWNGGPASIPRP